MPVTLIDILKPKNNQPFPLVEDIDLLGGFRVVQGNANRDAIGPKLKKHGMLVLVNDTRIIWSWNANTSTWESAIDLNNLGGGTGTQVTFTAECPSLAAVGDVVRAVPGVSATVDHVNVNDYYAMPAVGMIVSKTDPITAVVQISGMVTGVLSGLAPGSTYFAGRDSRLALPISLAPATGEAVFYQPLGIAITIDVFMLVPSVNLTRAKG